MTKMTIPNFQKKFGQMIKDSEITIQNQMNQKFKRFERKLKQQPSMVSLVSQRKS